VVARDLVVRVNHSFDVSPLFFPFLFYVYRNYFIRLARSRVPLSSLPESKELEAANSCNEYVDALEQILESSLAMHAAAGRVGEEEPQTSAYEKPASGKVSKQMQVLERMAASAERVTNLLALVIQGMAAPTPATVPTYQRAIKERNSVVSPPAHHVILEDDGNSASDVDVGNDHDDDAAEHDVSDEEDCS